MTNEASDVVGPASSPWRYRRPAMAGVVEWGDVRGRAVALPVHFHDEDQVTFVLAGRRRFQIDGVVVALERGEGVAIPAGTPHASLDEPEGVVCFNAYLPAGTIVLPPFVEAVARLWARWGHIPETAFLDLLDQHRQPEIGAAARVRHDSLADRSVAEAAVRARMSREGFSRAFRRTHGLPPRAFAGLIRLNAARGLLRAGLAPAVVAADTGFADQSHLGRCFRRAFGVTPGLYRTG